MRSLLEKELHHFERSGLLKRIFAGSADRGALQALFGMLRQLLAKWPDRPTRDLADLMFGRVESWMNVRAEELQKELDSQRQQGHSLKAADALLKLALGKQENRRYYYTPCHEYTRMPRPEFPVDVDRQLVWMTCGCDAAIRSCWPPPEARPRGWKFSNPPFRRWNRPGGHRQGGGGIS